MDAIQKVVDELRGSCDSLQSVAERHGLDPDSELLTDAVDQQIFLCSECGWWCEMHEEVSAFAGLDEWTCRQCAQDNHGYEGNE